MDDLVGQAADPDWSELTQGVHTTVYAYLDSSNIITRA